MTGPLYRLARLCVRRRFLVVGIWLVVTALLVVLSHRLGDNTNDNLSLPGTDSQRATDTLARSFPDQANGTSPIVLHASSGKLTESRYSVAVDQAAADVAKAPNVASVILRARSFRRAARVLFLDMADDLKIVTTVGSEAEAELVRERLSASDIQAISQRTIGGPEWGFSGARDVFVSARDLDRAHEVLKADEGSFSDDELARLSDEAGRQLDEH